MPGLTSPTSTAYSCATWETADIPLEDVVNFKPTPASTAEFRRDNNIPIPDDDDNDWVDADGDGIKDSRWTWAPVIKVGNVMYVMAVRIIDNSSLININAATAMTDDGLNGWGGSTTAPRGYFPTGIDLSRLLARSPALSSWASELPNLLSVRSVNGIPTPVGLNINNSGTITDSAGGRLDAWWNNTSLYGNPTNKFSLDDEFELRYHGGLNNPDTPETALPVETAMPLALLEDQDPNGGPIHPDPVQYSDVSGVSQNFHFFQGQDPNDLTNPNTPISSRDFPAIRHMLTAFSGTAVFATNHDGIHTGTAPTLKYDLVYQNGGSQAVGPDPTDPTNPDKNKSRQPNRQHRQSVGNNLHNHR